LRCPYLSAARDQIGEEVAAVIAARVESAPARAYESVFSTITKIMASQTIEIGIRPMRPERENRSAPGIANIER